MMNPNRIKTVTSINILVANRERLENMAKEDEISRSEFIDRLIFTTYHQRKAQKDQDAGLQTTLEIHVVDEAIRARSKDGKCNPNHVKGRCPTCWGPDA